MGEILIGIISGIVSGLGMGGGTILILLLTIVMKLEQHVAQAANLIFFIPTSVVAIIVNLKNKNVELKPAILVSIFGILGSIIGARFSVNTNVKILRKAFAVFLLVIVIHEIYTIIKENKNSDKYKQRKKYNSNTYNTWFKRHWRCMW